MMTCCQVSDRCPLGYLSHDETHFFRLWLICPFLFPRAKLDEKRKKEEERKAKEEERKMKEEEKLKEEEDKVSVMRKPVFCICKNKDAD